ncbi:hypothetical protein [Halocynthiibacter sp.]|uniref:hypothetical protein n=1 Tax=Halocynthiibacter sp. TaxID=1979210 RepID=UPI003C5844E2
MTTATRTIGNSEQLASYVQLLGNMKQPFTATTTPGIKRSYEQNRLQRMWVNEIAEQLGDRTAEEVRGECKLHIGVPILRAENEAFAASYDQIVRPLPYEAKMALMMVPFDFGVTRIMTTKQKTTYLDHMQRYWAGKGVVLTQPEERT